MMVVTVMLLVGCGGDDVTATTSPPPGDTAPAGTEDPGLGPVGGEEWPDAIPGDIPVLAGEITMVMADSTKVRLFYAGVSDDDLRGYLDQLESLGYDLEYVVYETPGNPGRAQERADAGEWDAVRATKGDYHLGLEFGAGTGTFDIGGIPMDGLGPDTAWPEAWSGVPAPSGLPISQVTDLGANGPLVEVAYETDDDITAYVAELEAAGFTVTDRSYDQNDKIISVTVGDGDHDVHMRTYPGGRLEISVSEATMAPKSEGAAPGVATREFPEWLPQVPGGELITATDEGENSFTAVVTIGDGHTVAEYVQVLIDAGYAETGTMLAGHILSDGSRTVTIYGDDGGLPPLQIMIDVKPS
ncbi:MAG: hypothetical protein WBV06_01765 [Acidimicrobiia bacterium]